MLCDSVSTFVLTLHGLHLFADVTNACVDVVDPVELGVVPDFLECLLLIYLSHLELSEVSSHHLFRRMKHPCVFIKRGTQLALDSSQDSIQRTAVGCLNQNNLIGATQHHQASDCSAKNGLVV